MTLTEIITEEGKIVTAAFNISTGRTTVLIPSELLVALRKYCAFHGKAVNKVVDAIDKARPEDINLSKAVRAVAREMRKDVTNEIEL